MSNNAADRQSAISELNETDFERKPISATLPVQKQIEAADI
ncbi:MULTISPECIES: hypothetical protein [Dysgonomonas]|uniref:Uncharacterized protein n=1 Tax=uncultured Dysgonomonas sp. TaxID=206096 RepID=A0A212JML4_9BACT|nr:MULTISPECIES: hypothetical protein [Dysgonomonas]SBW00638.1 hypothetical protein KL86DYS1_20246 [uncultured Dysgonomonas sp.]